MCGGIIAAIDDQELFFAVVPQARRGVGFAAFGLGVAGAFHFPYLLAGAFVEGNDPMAIGMKQNDIQAVFVKERRRMQTVLNFELAVAILQVDIPDFFAVKIETGEVPGADEDVNMLAIGG